MAYKHIVIAFDKDVIVTDNVKLSISYNDFFSYKEYAPVSQECISVYVPDESYVEGLKSSRQVVVEFEEPYNMCKGPITVDYSYGIVGQTGEPVASFIESFEPTPMPEYYVPRDISRISLLPNAQNTTYSVTKTEKNNTFDACVVVLTSKDASTTISYVGVVNP